MPRHALILMFCMAFAASLTAQSPTNPLLIHSNAPIAFDKVNATVIRDAVQSVITLSDKRTNQIISDARSGADKNTFLNSYDELEYELTDLIAKLSLISQTYSSDSTRNAANQGSQVMSDYVNGLLLNEGLYKAVKKYTEASMNLLAPNKKKFMLEQVRLFESSGMKLDSAGRIELGRINSKITGFGLAYDENLASSRDSLVLSESGLDGVPEKTKQAWKNAAGQYVVYINTPNQTLISENAKADSTRKKMYTAYLNRAYPENIPVLDSLLYYRQQYAQKLGYRSYAEFALLNKMAATPARVWEFMDKLIDGLHPKVTSDLESIRTIKHAMNPELADTVYAWDIAYYKKILLDTKFKLNTDELKEYFEMNHTISGMFEVYHRLFGLTVKEIQGLPTWDANVRSFEMYIGQKKIGTFYFDLYPRPNKYTHFACFGINQAAQFSGKEVLPVAALICNFMEGAKGEPILLEHQEVLILFHEFGHLVANMVVRSDIASQPNTLKPDFVEAPSQFLENFCWQYPSLKIFAKNYKTGEVLPESLFQKMTASRHVLDAYYYTRQLYLGSIDFTFEDKYDSIRGKDLTSVTKNLFRISGVPYPEGSHIIANFTHLNGYGANYYGYLWSRVYAQDIFSVFEKNGVMDAKTGERYRKEILEVAGREDEMDLLRHFLGREPNSDAFTKSLGL